MAKQILMGNEAIALGAMRAGVTLVTGYPGTPSSEILETVAKRGGVYVEWSVNEKCALEVAAGAAYAGARAMVTMKQVGLNVASDPLMSLNYVGVKGAMVIVAADDPGPISSQTEQDTRHFGLFAKIPVFDPSTPQEAYTMIADAFELSEKYGIPVLFRPTTRVCHSYASVDILEDLPKIVPAGFERSSRWVIFPRLAYLSHIEIEKRLKAIGDELSGYGNNLLTGGGNMGIATGGVSYTYVREALTEVRSQVKLLKVSAFPFPKKQALEFLKGLDSVLVIEELDPVIEKELLALAGAHHIDVKIEGKYTGAIQNAGELSPDTVSRAVFAYLGEKTQFPAAPALPPLPVRPPVLCAGCPHRASFFAVKEATRREKAVYSGDIGCYTLGNAMPLDMVDTCLCMGAGITVAQGLQRIEPDVLHFAFIGDSTFFHSGLTGIANAVYNRTDIIVAILDNGTTAMTGGQPHPGTGETMEGKAGGKISIYDIVSAIGVTSLQRVNPFDLPAAKAAVGRAAGEKGVRVILFEAPCINVCEKKAPHTVRRETCSGCGLCIKKLGCPAISTDGDKAIIDPALCTGCALCAKVCQTGAIGGAEND